MGGGLNSKVEVDMNRVGEDHPDRPDWKSGDDVDDREREDWSAWGNQTLDQNEQADTNKEEEIDIVFDADGLQKHYQYDDRLEAVSKALLNVELPGDCFVSGERMAFPLPGLFVQGIGSVSLPLIGSTASKLTTLCGGCGDHSLEERTTWEIPGGYVELKNAAWNDFAASDIIAACRGPLGLHSTLQVEAKFAKMVLCTAGGVIATSKDTDRATGVFATLLVVLPGRFAGGTMRVHAPVSDVNAPVSGANTHVWDPSATNEHAIKYAAFYVDCPVEMEPVASGYLLCLVYNLVVVEPTASTPHYGDNQPLYDCLRSTMSQFFAAVAHVEQRKRQRVDEQGSSNPVGFDISNPVTHRDCQLVYTLRDKYTHKELSFAKLEAQDSIVARSLIRFCDESHGAFEVYLAKIQFRMLYPMGRVPDDSKIKASECGTVLLLGCPWVAPDGTLLGTARPDLPIHQWQLGVADITTEVTPTGRFPSQNLDFDVVDNIVYARDTKLGTIQKLYTSAALVVVPLRVSARLQFTKDVTGTLTKWVARIDSNPSQAITMVSSFTEKPAWRSQCTRHDPEELSADRVPAKATRDPGTV